MINTKKLLLIVVLGNVFSQAAFGMLILKPMNRSLQQSRLIVKKNNKKRDINSNTYIAGDWVGGDKSNGDVHKIVIDGKNLDDKNDFTLYTHTDGDFIKKQSLYSYFTQLFTGSKKKRSEEIISFVGGHNIQTGAFGYVNTGYSNDSWLFSLMAAPFRAIGWTCKQAKRGTLSTYYWYKNSGDKNSVVSDIYKDTIVGGDIVGRNKIEQKIVNGDINTFNGFGNDKVGGTLDLTLAYNNKDFIKIIINNRTGEKSYDVKKGKNRFQGSFDGSQQDLEKFIKKLSTE